jgi:gag-polypeptide of LTR copia-type/Domain of unknown function (DUF4219)
MSSALKKLIPIRLNGSNWLMWSHQMTAYLRSQSLWQLVNGARACPTDLPGGANPAKVETRMLLQTDWDDKNDQVLGIIHLRITFALQTTYMATTTAAMWTTLKGAFDILSTASIFTDVKKAMAFKLSGTKDPLPEIMRPNKNLECLAMNGVDIPKPLHCMILLAGIPPQWDTLASNILATMKTATLVFNDIQDQIHNKYEYRSGRAAPQQKKESAMKISAVKRKGQDPKISQQCEKAPEDWSADLRSIADKPTKHKRKCTGRIREREKQKLSSMMTPALTSLIQSPEAI